jgi:hypothetical protein
MLLCLTLTQMYARCSPRTTTQRILHASCCDEPQAGLGAALRPLQRLTSLTLHNCRLGGRDLALALGCLPALRDLDVRAQCARDACSSSGSSSSSSSSSSTGTS